MTETNKRMDVIVLGLNIGTAADWGELGEQDIVFYDYAPAPGIKSLVPGDLCMVNAKGFVYTDADGSDRVVQALDVFSELSERLRNQS